MSHDDPKRFGILFGAWKRVFSRSPLRREALESVMCPRKRGPKGGKRYRCTKCRKDFGITQMQVDHIDPIVPVGTAARDLSWEVIESRLFCDVSNLQPLCKECHKKKSDGENKRRKKERAKK